MVAAQRNVSPEFNTTVTIPAFTTTVFWITEHTTTKPAAPVWETTAPFTLDAATDYGTNVVLHWQPSSDPAFYSYEVYRDKQTNLISPNPLSALSAMALRAAFWVDTNPGSGSHTYWIVAVSASGVSSDFSAPLVVSV